MNGNIFVIAEHDNKELDIGTFELIEKGKDLADQLCTHLGVILIGAACDPLAEKLSYSGCETVIVVADSRLEEYTPEVYSKITYEIAMQVKPSILLFGHTYRGIEMAPAVATKLDAAFVSNCIDLEIKDDALVAIRPLYQGTMRAKIKFESSSPWIVTLQKQGMPARAISDNKAEILSLKVEFTDEDIKSKPLGILKPPEGKIDITKANIIVSIGRGIKTKENIRIAEELAVALGGVVACSRPVSDFGWLPPECHVGMSGKIVSPKIYIACGISGASQHVTGMKGSQLIIAINSDANAPIFEIAKYGAIIDMFKLIPALTQEAKRS